MQQMTPLFERLGGREALLRLLTHFYADIRQHKLLGPIFASYVENWPEHIEKIADFWTQVSGGPMLYRGNMPGRHIPLGLREKEFQAWLGLWNSNCHIWLASECADELSLLANNIGLRLRQFCNVSQPSPLNIDFRSLS